VQTLNHSVRRINSSALPPGVKTHAIAGVHALGASYTPPASTSPHDRSVLQHLLQVSVTSATRFALVFAIVVVTVGTLLSFLIPRVPAPTEGEVDVLEPLEPMDVDPALHPTTSVP
jgi:hypothetical protein